LANMASYGGDELEEELECPPDGPSQPISESGISRADSEISGRSSRLSISPPPSCRDENVVDMTGNGSENSDDEDDRLSTASTVRSVPSSRRQKAHSAKLDPKRKPSPDQIENDNWSYMSDYFTLAEMPDSKGHVTYQCRLCMPSVQYYRGAKTSRNFLKHHVIKQHPQRAAAFVSLLTSTINKNRRQRGPDGNFTTPLGQIDKTQQRSVRDYRGIAVGWGVPGKAAPLRFIQEKLTDFFVELMIPMWVSKNNSKNLVRLSL